jgi:hypothetical protein
LSSLLEWLGSNDADAELIYWGDEGEVAGEVLHDEDVGDLEVELC